MRKKEYRLGVGGWYKERDEALMFHFQWSPHEKLPKPLAFLISSLSSKLLSFKTFNSPFILPFYLVWYQKRINILKARKFVFAERKWKLLSHVRLFATPMDYSPWNFPGQNTGVGSLSLLQGIFPTQGWNPGLPHWKQILYPLSYQGSPSRWNHFLMFSYL